MKGESNSNPYGLSAEEEELFQEVFKAGFTKLAKKLSSFSKLLS